jgi:hypothetical protein
VTSSHKAATEWRAGEEPEWSNKNFVKIVTSENNSLSKQKVFFSYTRVYFIPRLQGTFFLGFAM